jgi:hypothetical protein
VPDSFEQMTQKTCFVGFGQLNQNCETLGQYLQGLRLSFAGKLKIAFRVVREALSRFSFVWSLSRHRVFLTSLS